MKNKIKLLLKNWLIEINYKLRICYITYEDAKQFLFFNECFELIKDIKGNIVECGVG